MESFGNACDLNRAGMIDNSANHIKLDNRLAIKIIVSCSSTRSYEKVSCNDWKAGRKMSKPQQQQH